MSRFLRGCREAAEAVFWNLLAAIGVVAAIVGWAVASALMLMVWAAPFIGAALLVKWVLA